MLQIMSGFSRRSALTVVATLALIGTGLIAPTIAQAADTTGEVAAVATAVETMRAAMVAGDEKVLNSLVNDRLTYGHSKGALQNKAEFVKALVGPKAPGKFNWLKLSNQTIEVVDNNAMVRHVFDSENANPDGTTSNAHIAVLQVWKKENSGWMLLARQSCLLPQ